MKKRKCDLCDQNATHHSVEIVKGQKIEKHLCELHATEAGLSIKTGPQTPINDLLTQFVKLHGGDVHQDMVCGHCGLTFGEFREHSLLGCPNCYEAFNEQLSSLLERAHEGAVHHVGKVPARAGEHEERQQLLMRMHKRLDEAVASEDYELAARLRDDIHTFEGSGQ